MYCINDSAYEGFRQGEILIYRGAAHREQGIGGGKPEVCRFRPQGETAGLFAQRAIGSNQRFEARHRNREQDKPRAIESKGIRRIVPATELLWALYILKLHAAATIPVPCSLFPVPFDLPLAIPPAPR